MLTAAGASVRLKNVCKMRRRKVQSAVHSMKGVMMLSVCVVVAFNVCGLCFLCGCVWIVRCHVCYVVDDEDGCVYASYLPFEERLTAVPSL